MKPHPFAPAALVALFAVLSTTASAQASHAQVCEQDTSVQERFIPVELLNGLPMTDTRELRFGEVDRSYPFVDVLPDGKLSSGEASLKGPMQWVGMGGKDFEVYERKVPRSHERFALTPDRTAIGRVFDQRFGNAANEGKFPVGLWRQGQKRSYDTVYGTRNAVSSIEIEKLACTWDGIANSLQYRWKTNNGLDYGYIYAPGRGVVQVFTYSNGR